MLKLMTKPLNNIRNFALVVNTNSSTRTMSPVRKDGGFKVTVFIREDKKISEKTIEIYGIAKMNNELEIGYFIRDKNEPFDGVVKHETILTTKR